MKWSLLPWALIPVVSVVSIIGTKRQKSHMEQEFRTQWLKFNKKYQEARETAEMAQQEIKVLQSQLDNLKEQLQLQK